MTVVVKWDILKQWAIAMVPVDPISYFFSNNAIKHFFTDLDECANTTFNICSDAKNETCYNTVGSYTCDCKPGFSRRNGQTCEGKVLCYVNVVYYVCEPQLFDRY